MHKKLKILLDRGVELCYKGVMSTEYQNLMASLERIERRRGEGLSDSPKRYETFASLFRDAVDREMEEDIIFIRTVSRDFYGEREPKTVLSVGSDYKPGEPHVLISMTFKRFGEECLICVKNEKSELRFRELFWYIKRDETANKFCAELREAGLDEPWVVQALREALSALKRLVAEEAKLTLEEVEDKIYTKDQPRQVDIGLRKLQVEHSILRINRESVDKYTKRCIEWIKLFEGENLNKITETATLLRRTRDVLGCVPMAALNIFEAGKTINGVSETMDVHGDKCRLSVELGECISSEGAVYKPLRFMLYCFGSEDEKHSSHEHSPGYCVNERGVYDFIAATKARGAFCDSLPELGNAIIEKFDRLRDILAETIERSAE